MNLEKILKKKDFETVFQALAAQDFDYSLSSIEKAFRNCDPALLYSFLMYSVSKSDTAEKHLSICKYLMYCEPYIYECTSMIRWHIKYALGISEHPEKIMSWVIEVFGADPSSPFSEDEMLYFAKEVSLRDPNNTVAINILNPLTKS